LIIFKSNDTIGTPLEEDSMEQPKKVKKWYKSRTIIVNAVAAGLGALEMSNPGGIPTLGPALVVALPVINAILRAITTQPLSK
jgi:hypothetical protein